MSLVKYKRPQVAQTCVSARSSQANKTQSIEKVDEGKKNCAA